MELDFRYPVDGGGGVAGGGVLEGGRGVRTLRTRVVWVPHPLLIFSFEMLEKGTLNSNSSSIFDQFYVRVTSNTLTVS